MLLHRFQVLFYSAGVNTYHFIIFLASHFNNKAKLFVEGRKMVLSNLAELAPKLKGNKYWFHCASLGEFEQGRPLIEAIKRLHPDSSIILTFFSPSGYEVQKNYPLANAVYYLPKDSASNARKWFEILAPDGVFFVKYEFWYHYLHQANTKKVPLYLISATFHSEQIFFKYYGGFFRRILKMYNQIFVQNNSSKKLLEEISITSIKSGDTRFDRVLSISITRKPIPFIEKFKGNQLLLVLGSSWEAEEEILSHFLKKKPSNLKIVIAPHDISRSENLARQFGGTLFSKFSANQKTELLIVDNIGMLSSLYYYADIAFVGGGYSGKLHNILEAAVFGKPVIFGPEINKFHEALELIQMGGGFAAKNESDFLNIINKLTKESRFRETTGAKAAAYVSENTGATDKILRELF